MLQILLIIHLLIALALIGVVLLQRSEGGALGIGGGSGGGGGMAGFMTGRSTANLLTRTTAFLAAAFMTTSILLTLLGGGGDRPASIVDELPSTAPAEESTGGEAPAEDSGEPSVPVQ
jgi:preprotein translocase subunit SecG